LLLPLARQCYDRVVTMSEHQAIQELVREVLDNLELTTQELLYLLQQRTGRSIFSLATYAEMDPGAFNKIFNAKKGRNLRVNNVRRLIRNLSNEKLISNHAYFGRTEADIWLMALQCVAAADRQLNIFKDSIKAVDPSYLRFAREQLVKAFREIWIGTHGILPEYAPLSPPDIGLLTLTVPERSAEHAVVICRNRNGQRRISMVANLGFFHKPGDMQLNTDVRYGKEPFNIELHDIADSTVHCFVVFFGKGPTLSSDRIPQVRFRHRLVDQTVTLATASQYRYWNVFAYDPTAGTFSATNALHDDWESSPFGVELRDFFPFWFWRRASLHSKNGQARYWMVRNWTCDEILE